VSRRQERSDDLTLRTDYVGCIDAVASSGTHRAVLAERAFDTEDKYPKVPQPGDRREVSLYGPKLGGV